MYAKAIINILDVTPLRLSETEVILETPCRDYDEFSMLPNVVEFQCILFGKTGWSSDTNKAYYKQGRNFAKVV